MKLLDARAPTFRNRITTRVLLLSAAAAILLGARLVLLIVAVNGQRDAARLAFRSAAGADLGNQLEKSLLSIENGLRGYVASGRRASCAGHVRHARLSRRARAPESLVSDDPGQRAAVDEIGEEIDDYVTLWARPLLGARPRAAPARRAASS